MTRSLRLAGIACLGASALALTACGGNGDDGAKKTTVNPALTKSEIKLGLIVSRTGTSSSSDKSGADVALAWQRWVNAGQGIAGHPVRIVVKDDKSDGATATAAAQELLADPNVLSITTEASNTEQPVASALGGKDVPVVGATGYQTKIWTAQPNYFPTAPQAFPATVAVQIASAKAVGAHKFAAVYCAEIAACKEAVGLYGPIAQQQGVQYVGSVAASTTAPSYTAECLRLKNMGADLVQISIAPAAGRKLISDCTGQGYKGYFGVTAGAVNADITKTPNAKLVGGLQGFPWWADTPQVKQFRDAMKKYAPDADYANPASTAVWSTLELIRKAAANLPDKPTRKDMTAGLHTIKDEDLGGLLAQKLTYTAGKPGPAINCLWVYKMQNGKFASAPLSGPSGNSAASGPLKSDCMAAPAAG
ncbi:ABC transporter substrate-binding protein [Actinomadura sp. LD22]|uniref:ABC transporter substrate-binding protein n=1 Tax=Actinomadura physcomitrii TaxID=2650748 RepID=A0A6I4M5V0_9ACTN|nr:ABC transporter substrate-binding protein [Actinomadura physcomitrii]MWA00932.1 ABC transporter substrate-binding protein [Actinomadura physcomitrii]